MTTAPETMRNQYSVRWVAYVFNAVALCTFVACAPKTAVYPPGWPIPTLKLPAGSKQAEIPPLLRDSTGNPLASALDLEMKDGSRLRVYTVGFTSGKPWETVLADLSGKLPAGYTLSPDVMQSGARAKYCDYISGDRKTIVHVWLTKDVYYLSVKCYDHPQ